MTPELHINKQVPAAEVGALFSGVWSPSGYLVSHATPVRLLPQSLEQQDDRALQFLLPSSPTSKQLAWGVKASAEQCWVSPSSPRAPHSHMNCCGRSRFRASNAARAKQRADDWERTHHPHAHITKKLQEEDGSPSVLTCKADLTKSERALLVTQNNFFLHNTVMILMWEMSE